MSPLLGQASTESNSFMTYKSFKRAKNPDTPEFTSKYYITNSVLLPEVLESKKNGRMTAKLAEMLMKLTRKYANKPCFIGYSYRDDMISEALTNLCQNALKFNPEKSSNPFAYYTTCINSSFLQYLNFEKKHRKIRDELLIEVGENPSFGFQEEYSRQHNESGEFKSELADMATQIVEAKERLRLDAEYAAKKAALQAAEALAAVQALDVEMLESTIDTIEPAFESDFIDSPEELDSTNSLLEFETPLDAEDQD
jgi:DNA-directed RNA polymerase specialized sigma subunit